VEKKRIRQNAGDKSNSRCRGLCQLRVMRERVMYLLSLPRSLHSTANARHSSTSTPSAILKREEQQSGRNSTELSSLAKQARARRGRTLGFASNSLGRNILGATGTQPLFHKHNLDAAGGIFPVSIHSPLAAPPPLLRGDFNPLIGVARGNLNRRKEQSGHQWLGGGSFCQYQLPIEFARWNLTVVVVVSLP
jgi:hypothetical protein